MVTVLDFSFRLYHRSGVLFHGSHPTPLTSISSSLEWNEEFVSLPTCLLSSSIQNLPGSFSTVPACLEEYQAVLLLGLSNEN